MIISKMCTRETLERSAWRSQDSASSVKPLLKAHFYRFVLITGCVFVDAQLLIGLFQLVCFGVFSFRALCTCVFWKVIYKQKL